jgi:hypothetical protein
MSIVRWTRPADQPSMLDTTVRTACTRSIESHRARGRLTGVRAEPLIQENASNDFRTEPKSGKGLGDGVVSELTTLFTVKPGHAQQLPAACQTFIGRVRGADAMATHKRRLRDVRLVMFDKSFASAKRFLEANKVQASACWKTVADQLAPQIRNGQQVAHAFEQLRDHPAAAEALQHPASSPRATPVRTESALRRTP